MRQPWWATHHHQSQLLSYQQLTTIDLMSRGGGYVTWTNWSEWADWQDRRPDGMPS